VTTAQRDFWLRCGAAVAAMFLLAPAFGALLPAEPFHRVMSRTLQVGLVIALLVRRGSLRTWPTKVHAMGMRGPGRAARFGAGFGVAFGAMVAFLVLSWALGGRPLHGPEHRLSFGAQLLQAAVAGLAVAYFEELLCRGYLKDVLGDVGSATIFAGVHLFRPLQGSLPAGSGYKPLLAFERFPDMVESWTDPRLATLGFVSLWVFAMGLNRLRDRTGTLYLGIGFHAGLVFVLALYRRYLVTSTPGDPWIFGGTRLHDGLLGAIVLGLFMLAAYRLPLPRRFRGKP